jgi:hypothetical protein
MVILRNGFGAVTAGNNTTSKPFDHDQMDLIERDPLLLFSPIPSPIFLFCECEER